MVLIALVASVFLNGVPIDGVRAQTFDKCRSVRIDERGDVHLDCPGYQAQPQAGAAAPPVLLGAPLGKRYFLVTEQKDGGVVQYDVDVFVNAKWVRKLKSAGEQVVFEITKYLRPGPNKVLFAATKRIEGGRQSTSPWAFLKVVVGEGESDKSQVVIDNPLLEYRRSAAETENVNEEFTLQAR